MPASLFAKRFHIPFQVKDGTKVTVVAERYSKVAEPPRHGRILICCHAVSATKEHWIPVLERLFEQEDLNISEAWAYDSPNHGDSLPYNKGLMNRPDIISNLATVGDSLHAILRTGLIHHDTQELIPIGHSAGTNAVIRLAMAYIRAGQPVPFKSAILIETVFLPEKVGIKVVGRYRPFVEARPWKWNTIDEAQEFIHNYPAWQKWHPEIKKIHFEYSMVHAVTGSQLKCPSHVEAACYPNADIQDQALKDLPVACEHINIYNVFGARNDFVPKPIRDQFMSFAKNHVKSITMLEGVGHMLVQEDPIKCSGVLSDILRSIQPASVGLEQVQAKL